MYVRAIMCREGFYIAGDGGVVRILVEGKNGSVYFHSGNIKNVTGVKVLDDRKIACNSRRAYSRSIY